MVASKRDAITAIIEMNPTANPVFLSEFSKNDLEQYLDRLGRAIASDVHQDRLSEELPASPTNSEHDEAQPDERWW